MNDRVYRIAPRYRRCCWYVLVAAPIVIATYWWLAVPAKGIAIEEAIGASIGLGMIACLVALPPFSWRLTIDERGWRRRFLGIETLWPWAEFENGQIAAAGASYRHRQRPWWNPWNSIHVGYLTEDDLVAVMATIDPFFPAESPPEPPDEILIRLLGERIRLDDNGVHAENRRGGASYSWSEVIAVDVLRGNGKSAGFSMLEIVLPGRVVTLRNVKGKTAGFSNPAPAVIAEFLRRRVNDSRYSLSLGDEPMTNFALVKRRAAAAHRDLKELRWCFGALSAAVAAMVSWMILDNQSLLPLVFLVWLLPLLMVWLKQEQHAARWREFVKDDRWRTAPPPRLEI
jgi:hypothetical protein